MCDWEEAEFAEYLLWAEAARARALARAASSARALPTEVLVPTVAEPASAEA